jgi:hypothetical protein
MLHNASHIENIHVSIRFQNTPKAPKQTGMKIQMHTTFDLVARFLSEPESRVPVGEGEAQHHKASAQGAYFSCRAF